MAKTIHNADLEVLGTVLATGIPNGTGDFLTRNTSTNFFQRRTAAEVLTDIGGAPLVHTHLAADITDSSTAFVDFVSNQYAIGGEKTFTGAVQLFDGRVGVQTPVFGGTRLGDSVFQAPSIDVNSINIKDTGQLTALAIFTTAVGGSDGYVTSYKNFVDSVNVMSIAGLGQETYGGVGREVESTIGLRNDFTGGEFTVLDMFNQDYDAATEVADSMGWVAIHGSGATAKEIGLWRYDTTTYTPIWELSPSNVWTFGVDINVPDEAYGIGWDTSTEVPTKNAIYDKIESLVFTSTLADLTDTTITGPAVGNFIRWNGSAWVDTDLIAGDIPDISASYVALTGDQTASGIKTWTGTNIFQGTVQIGDGGTYQGEDDGTLGRRWYIRKDQTTNDWLWGYQTADSTTIAGAYSTLYRLHSSGTPTNGTDLITKGFADTAYAADSHTHLLAAGATDVTATAAELNLLDLSGLTVGWVLSADSATTASWKAPSAGATTLAALTDTTITTPATGQYLRHDGTDWKNSAILAGDIPTLTDYVAVTGDTMTGALTLDTTLAGDNWVVRADTNGVNFSGLWTNTAEDIELFLRDAAGTASKLTPNGGAFETSGDLFVLGGGLNVGNTTTLATINVHKGDAGLMSLSFEDNYLRWRRGGGGTISGWRWDNFDSQAARLTTGGQLTLGTDSLTTGELLTHDGTFGGTLFVEEHLGWRVSSADLAIQRADARDDNTDEARLHWYGQNTVGGTECFRHAWYDGNNYMNLTYLSDIMEWSTTTTPLTFKITSNVDASLIVQADRDNATETDNPTIELWQDAELVKAIWGIEGTANSAFTGTRDNTPYFDTLAAGGYDWAVNGDYTMALHTDGLRLQDGRGIGIDDAAHCRVPAPGGAFHHSSTATETGAIEIRLPVAAWNTSDMISFEVTIFDYAGGDGGGESIKLFVYGYPTAAVGNWANTKVVVLTDRSDRGFNVRFGSIGTTQNALWIGETTSTWSYPQVQVSNFQGGFNADISRWIDGWAIDVVTSFSTVDHTTTAKYPNASTLGGFSASTSATANTIALRDSGGRLDADELDINGNAIRLLESSDRPGLLQVWPLAADPYAGIQLRDEPSDQYWSFMGDDNNVGIYDDTNNEWILLYNENSQVALYFNGASKLVTTNIGITVTGTGTATDWINTSDKRLKKNVKPLGEYAITTNWKKYNWKEDGKFGVGLIAQDLEKTNPEFVTTDDEGMKSVSYTQVLVAKMAEKDRQIEDLTTRIERLELIVKELM